MSARNRRAAELKARVRELRSQGLALDAIVEALAREGRPLRRTRVSELAAGVLPPGAWGTKTPEPAPARDPSAPLRPANVAARGDLAATPPAAGATGAPAGKVGPSSRVGASDLARVLRGLTDHRDEDTVFEALVELRAEGWDAAGPCSALLQGAAAFALEGLRGNLDEDVDDDDQGEESDDVGAGFTIPELVTEDVSRGPTSPRGPKRSRAEPPTVNTMSGPGAVGGRPRGEGGSAP